MTKAAVRKVALTLEAYGFELRLWKEDKEREWGATLSDGNHVSGCHFEEDNLILAKLHLLGEARSRAISRPDSANLPNCDAFLESWKPISLTKITPEG